MSMLKPNGCTCGEISVGGVNSPSRRQMLIERPDCPWHGHLREQDEMRRKLKKLEELHLVTLVAAIVANGKPPLTARIESDEDFAAYAVRFARVILAEIVKD